jgi:uncharacterized repeat protein (TIGR03803 family)
MHPAMRLFTNKDGEQLNSNAQCAKSGRKPKYYDIGTDLFVFKELFVVVVFSFFTLLQVNAQSTLTTLHNFTNSPDGATPKGGLTFSGNTMYGTAQQGGLSGAGTVFRLNTGGSGFTNLYSFLPIVSNGSIFTNSGGAYPAEVLILSGNALYGTSFFGGTNGNGTVFSLSTNGTGFTVLYTFTATSGANNTNSDGASPAAGLAISGNTLYGSTSVGGIYGSGTLFSLNINGSSFTNLHNFNSGNDGSGVQGRLLLSSNTLYGTTIEGGTYNSGTVFSVSNNSASFIILHTFTLDHTQTGNSDGANPVGGLILSGNTLYGTAGSGGTSDNGAVFRVNTDTTDFTNLHSFSARSSGNVNSDGAYPRGDLILSGNTLYGMTYTGGNFGNGAVFAINTGGGTSFTNLHSFTATSGTKSTNSDGTVPFSDLVYAGNILYGLASAGGGSGHGTVFSLSLPGPQLTINSAGGNVDVTWPTNITGFTLEFATNLATSAAWSTDSTTPIVINGTNVVINSASGTKQFYRLIQ